MFLPFLQTGWITHFYLFLLAVNIVIDIVAPSFLYQFNIYIYIKWDIAKIGEIFKKIRVFSKKKSRFMEPTYHM